MPQNPAQWSEINVQCFCLNGQEPRKLWLIISLYGHQTFSLKLKLWGLRCSEHFLGSIWSLPNHKLGSNLQCPYASVFICQSWLPGHVPMSLAASAETSHDRELVTFQCHPFHSWTGLFIKKFFLLLAHIVFLLISSIVLVYGSEPYQMPFLLWKDGHSDVWRQISSLRTSLYLGCWEHLQRVGSIKSGNLLCCTHHCIPRS